MKIDFSGINVKNYFSSASKPIVAPAFCGMIKDEFIHTDTEYLKTKREKSECILDLGKKVSQCDDIAYKIHFLKTKGEDTSKEQKALMTATQERKKLKHKMEVLGAKERGLVYDNQVKLHPNSAFLYDPEFSAADKRRTLKAKEEIKELSSLAKKCNIPFSYMEKLEVKGLLEGDSFEDKIYIDTDFEKNKNFINKLTKVRKINPTLWEFQENCNFSEKEIKELESSFGIKYLYLNEDDIKNTTFYERGNYLVDIKNKDVQNIIAKQKMKTPISAGVYYKKAGKTVPNVPIAALASLGFSSAEKLYKAVLEGKLKGTIEKVEQNGKKVIKCAVDINSLASEVVLQGMREENKDVCELSEFSNMIGIPKNVLKQAILNRELEIIPYFLFEQDRNKIFINLAAPKNRAFLNKMGLT